MKPRIRKKGKDYCLEYLDDNGVFRAKTLNPEKILKLLTDSQKLEKSQGGNQ